MHPGASAAYGGKGTGCLNASGSLFVEFGNGPFAETLGFAGGFDFDHVAWCAAGDEHHFTVIGASNRVCSIGHTGDLDAHYGLILWFSWGNKNVVNHNV